LKTIDNNPMKHRTTKRNLLLLILTAVVCYFLGIFGHLNAFLVTFVLFYVLSYSLFTNVIWNLQTHKTRQRFKNNQIFLHIIVVGCIILFLLGRSVISKHYMQNTFPLIRLSAKFGLLAFIIYYGIRLCKTGLSKINIFLAVLYLGFVIIPFLPSLFKLSNNEKGNKSKFNIEALRSLPYTNWTPVENINNVSVTLNNKQLANKGINVYNFVTKKLVNLIDMEGNVLHSINLDRKNEIRGYSQKSEFCKNGDIVCYFRDKMVARIDWNGLHKWQIKTRAHHDFDIRPNEQIYILTRKDSVMRWRFLPVPVLEDMIYVISPEGKYQKTIGFLEPLKKDIPPKTVLRLYCRMIHPLNLAKIMWKMLKAKRIFKASSVFDIMHTNSVDVSEKNVPGLCSKDDILISIRDMNLVVIYSPKKSDFVWKWGPGEISGQHHAQFQENGNIMLFDNGTCRGIPVRNFSRVIEINPKTKQIEWEYTESPKEKFFTTGGGENQKLPNGNVLITETCTGRVFEVTTDGRKVWEFYNPHNKDGNKLRATIPRMFRIVNPQDYRHIRDLEH